MVAAALLIAAPAFAQGGNEGGHGHAVVTIFARHSEMSPNISQQDVSIKINGKDSSVTGWTPLHGANDGLELVVLIDGGARNLGRQFEEIKQFIQGLSPHTKAAVGYMQNGQAILAGPLSADHAQVVGEIHLSAGPSSNPYFSLSDLAQHWPSGARGVRREVVLVSEGLEERLVAGDAAGFAAGEANGHCLQNRSAAEVLLLEIGTRNEAEDETTYPDIDLKAPPAAQPAMYTHRDGTPYQGLRRRGPGG